jgi:Rieske Fe-S protein
MRMPEEDQNHVEAYLELECYLEDLQSGRAGRLPEDMTPEQARIYRMAALFHAASDEAVEPDAAFVERLRSQLLSQPPVEQQEEVPTQRPVEPQQGVQGLNSDTREVPPQPPAALPAHPRRLNAFSRRALLAAGAISAASLVVGAGIEHAVEQIHQQKTSTPPYHSNSAFLLDQNVPTTWYLVTTLEELGDGAVRFATNAIVGYVIHLDSDDEESEQIIALSAACTHMGCIVQWSDKDRQLHCPCHNGQFDEYGKPTGAASRALYLTSLPRLHTKVENGNVYVAVPVIK